MNLILHPRPLSGRIAAIPSKSWAHRLLLGAALSGSPTVLSCDFLSGDVAATLACLSAMGVSVTYQDGTLQVQPGPRPGLCRLPCGQSGSTLRFLLPVVAALGISADFNLEGRLPLRPLGPPGSRVGGPWHPSFPPGTRPSPVPGPLAARGIYAAGKCIQPIHLRAPVCPPPSGRGEYPYSHRPGGVRAIFGDDPGGSGAVRDPHPFRWDILFHLPYPLSEPWAAPARGGLVQRRLLALRRRFGRGHHRERLRRDSLQGDRAICPLLAELGATLSWEQDRCTIAPGRLRPIRVDARPIPDLVPILAVAAAAAPGESRMEHAGRLRLKESDRLEATCRLLQDLGGSIRLEGDCLVIQGGTPLPGGAVESFGDHRIAMAAAVAASLCQGPVRLSGAEAVTKSYPRFWQDYRSLGGIWEETP